ncbi:hypothetical protein JCM19240_5325 [Vibrio maritimus]|uniref:Uncharacterized protein n=1 Tax=Vibrio maritimus TaxID=990268 RepID=A0A090SZM3_9VIBR|nr:hypothetical protein JCM19240_5325 [Vibrio maritimus]
MGYSAAITAVEAVKTDNNTAASAVNFFMTSPYLSFPK